MKHEARTDSSMLLGLLFLLIVGGGAWSVDARLGRKGKTKREEKSTNT
jgi:putative oxidoreductase